MRKKCVHDKIEFLGEQKGEEGVNRYYKCLKCKSILVLSEENILYEVPEGNYNRYQVETSTKKEKQKLTDNRSDKKFSSS